MQTVQLSLSLKSFLLIPSLLFTLLLSYCFPLHLPSSIYFYIYSFLHTLILTSSNCLLPLHFLSLLHYLILLFSSSSPLLIFFSSTFLLFLQAEAPLNTIMRLLRHLIPQVAHLTQDQSGADELQIIQFIRRTTMVIQSDMYGVVWFGLGRFDGMGWDVT